MSRHLRTGLLVAIACAGLWILWPFPSWQPLRTPHDDRLAGFPGHAPLARSALRVKTVREYSLLFAGDVMLARGVGAKMRALDDWGYPFCRIASTLRAADVAYCNLECPISDQGRDRRHLYSFRADPRALKGLTEAGFDVVSQANNHAFDWGAEALLDSLRRLQGQRIRVVGAGRNELVARYPVILDRQGLRVAFLAYVDIDPREASAQVDRVGVAWLEPESVLADIRFARPLVDLVIVCPHWGIEYAARPTRTQIQLAHRMIDAGADLVVGSHAHVVQPLEQYRGHWIAYSLGNFVFDQKPPATHRGLMLRVLVRDRRIVQVTPVPVHINSSFQAVIDPSPERHPAALLAHDP